MIRYYEYYYDDLSAKRSKWNIADVFEFRW